MVIGHRGIYCNQNTITYDVPRVLQKVDNYLEKCNYIF